MSTLSITLATPGTVTGLVATAGVKSITLSWDVAVNAVSYEIWHNTTNSIGSAALFDETDATTYTAVGLSTSSSHYFWVRGKTVFGALGSYSSSATASLNAITSSDVATSAVTSSSTSISVSSSAPTVSTYGTWYTCSTASFTAGTNDITSISMYVNTTVSSLSSSGTDILNVWARSRLFDTTTSTTVPGGTKQQLLLKTFSTTTFGQLTNIANFNETLISGFRGLLTPGHSYALYVEVMKEQASGSPTCTLSVNGASMSSSSSATVS